MQCKSIDEYMKYGLHNNQAYQLLRTLTKISPRSTSIIEDNNGKPLASEMKILNRRTEYSYDIYTYLINLDTSIMSNAAFSTRSRISIELSILDTEVMDEINTLKYM